MGKPLHIGYLLAHFPPETGALPARATEMVRHWRSRGADVSIFTAFPHRPEGRIHPEYRGKAFTQEDWDGVRVFRSWLFARPGHGIVRTTARDATFMISGGWQTARNSQGLDVLIASSPPLFPHVAGALVRRFRGVPLVLEIRDLWPDYLVAMGIIKQRTAVRSLLALERRLLLGSDHVVVVTDSFRSRIIAKGVAPERVDVVPNGVESSAYYPSRDEPPLPSLQRQGDEFIVGYLGNFGAGQALEHVLDAAALLATEDPTIRLILAGGGSERPAIVAKAQRMRLPNVAVHDGIPKDRTRAFYNCCDACLIPLAPVEIFQETIPSKIFEVMACERPVVASLDGEARAIVEQSGAGVVCPPGNARAIADAIKRLKALPAEERTQMGVNGGRYVKQHFNREALAEKYFDILNRVARRRS